jgi:hypothetical protein
MHLAPYHTRSDKLHVSVQLAAILCCVSLSKQAAKRDGPSFSAFQSVIFNYIATNS